MNWSAVALALCAACSVEPGPRPARTYGPTPPPPPAAAPPVAEGFVGVIVPGEVVDLAPADPGVLTAVHVRAGDRVAAGQLVAELDPSRARDESRAAEAALAGTLAELARARVDLAEARRRLALEERGVQDGVSPRVAAAEAAHAVRRAEAAVQQATNSVAAQRARAESARRQLADTRLVAPFAGQVAWRARDPGATVGRGEPLVRLLRDGPLLLRFAVPPARARDLRPGAVVVATVEAVSPPVRARVARVAPGLDPASGLVLVEASVADEPRDGALRPGLAATVSTP